MRNASRRSSWRTVSCRRRSLPSLSDPFFCFSSASERSSADRRPAFTSRVPSRFSIGFELDSTETTFPPTNPSVTVSFGPSTVRSPVLRCIPSLWRISVTGKARRFPSRLTGVPPRAGDRRRPQEKSHGGRRDPAGQRGRSGGERPELEQSGSAERDAEGQEEENQRRRGDERLLLEETVHAGRDERGGENGSAAAPAPARRLRTVLFARLLRDGLRSPLETDAPPAVDRGTPVTFAEAAERAAATGALRSEAPAGAQSGEDPGEDESAPGCETPGRGHERDELCAGVYALRDPCLDAAASAGDRVRRRDDALERGVRGPDVHVAARNLERARPRGLLSLEVVDLRPRDREVVKGLRRVRLDAGRLFVVADCLGEIALGETDVAAIHERAVLFRVRLDRLAVGEEGARAIASPLRVHAEEQPRVAVGRIGRRGGEQRVLGARVLPPLLEVDRRPIQRSAADDVLVREPIDGDRQDSERKERESEHGPPPRRRVSEREHGPVEEEPEGPEREKDGKGDENDGDRLRRPVAERAAREFLEVVKDAPEMPQEEAEHARDRRGGDRKRDEDSEPGPERRA